MPAAWRSQLVRFLVRRLERELPRLVRVLSRLGVDVLGPARAAARPPRRRRLEVVKISPSTVVVSRPRLAREERLAREKLLFSYLATSHIAGVLERYRVNCVIDVGGNRGHYGRMLRAAGYEGHIVSFEPVPHLFEKLARAARKDRKWTVHDVALGAEDGVTSMVPETAKGWRTGLSSVLPPTSFGTERYRVLNELSTEEVTLRRLDGLLDEVTAGVPDPRLYLKTRHTRAMSAGVRGARRAGGGLRGDAVRDGARRDVRERAADDAGARDLRARRLLGQRVLSRQPQLGPPGPRWSTTASWCASRHCRTESGASLEPPRLVRGARRRARWTPSCRSQVCSRACTEAAALPSPRPLLPGFALAPHERGRAGFTVV